MKKLILTFTLAFYFLSPINAQHTFNTEYNEYFEKAYQLYPDIPKGLLEAIAYTNTHVRHITPDEAHSCTGMPQALGVMGLYVNGKGVFTETAVLASIHSKIPIETIIDNPIDNILGFAALYNYCSALGQTKRSIENHYQHIMVLSGLSLDNNGFKPNYYFDTYLYSVLDILNNPYFQKAYNTPEYTIDLRKVFGDENYKVLSSKYVQITGEEITGDNGVQYIPDARGGCLDYPSAIWSAAASCNYSSRSGTAVSAVTIHTIQGSYSSAINWFQNCQASVSAHYVVRSSDGQITQMVCESDKAWHVGSENPYTIGIEHEGYIADPQTWYTNAMYNSSAALVRDITTSGYGINPLRTFDNNPRYNWDDELGGCVKIKGHVNFPNQSHTDPGSGWDWEKYYQLINNTPNVTTYVTGTGTFYDSGGSSGNYGDDERKLYLFSPTNSASVTLSFTQFDLEDNWDYLYIYDGNSLSSPLIGAYTGTNGPGTVTSTGNSLLVELRSDCATNNTGWAATWTSDQPDVTPPVTSVSVSGNWQTTDFTGNYTDTDLGSGIAQTYYQVQDFDGTEWRANGAYGFLNDDFDVSIHPDWTTEAGTWTISGSRINQSDEGEGNSNIHIPLSQGSGNGYLYHWSMNQNGSGSNRRAGLHFFCDDPTMDNRGNSYFVYFRADNNKCQIYRVTNNIYSLETNDTLVINPNVWYDYKVTYNPGTGSIKIYQNDVLASSWADSSPLTSGNSISLRTGNANVSYDDLEVYKTRGNSTTITIGNASAEVRYQNPSPSIAACKISSLVIDNTGNWSSIGSTLVDVDWTPPADVTVNDGLGADIDITYSTASLSANWTTSSDQHSNVLKYWYAIGSSPGGTDIVDWTDNGFNNSVTETGLSLIVGNTYYVSARAENGAGLLSNIISSDGQLVDVNTGSEDLAVDNLQLAIYPNPSNGEFNVSFRLNEGTSVDLYLQDALGRQIAWIGKRDVPGEHRIALNVNDYQLANGTYYLELVGVFGRVTKKLVLMK